MLIIGTKFYQTKVITMMKSYDQFVEINHNPNQPYILDHPYKLLITGGSGSRKTRVIEPNKTSTTTSW